jgi:hypothetical protein
MAQIAAAEKMRPNVLQLRAKQYFYSRAGRAEHIGSGISICLVLIGPFFLLFAPGAGPVLGAIAGAWLFVTRYGIDRLVKEWQLKGVRAQEGFDCNVLGISWNHSLAKVLAPEEVHGAASKDEAEEEKDSWYPVDIECDWPISVLICQRSNAVWASRQHRSYSYVLIAAIIAWGCLGVVLALAHRATLQEYLVTVLLPSLPALLEVSDLVKRHQWAAGQREAINEQLEGLISRGRATAIEIREVQDQLFGLRRDGANVPEWFYRRLRDDFEEDMRYGARQMLGGA